MTNTITRKIFLIPSLLLLTACLPGCVTNSVLADPVDCTELIPDTWEEGVGHANQPDFDEVPQEEIPPGFAPLQWFQSALNFGLAEAGQVDKADERLRDAMHIQRTCTENNRRAVERAKPKFLGIF
ncbi:MAG: hypothetical protein Unbinned4120contig1000_50 [Prokaryotic dsDNA virus sp.]|jgi:hypothetical protein|nr:MAG: hypothetical protein Unbinned4120contig1000_50 [Prokaryotic dsDNA virus sp.]|tara:strand:- start:25044 stop:25421 length:378 start_codon:yes stop_codon:yes gene_type:complete